MAEQQSTQDLRRGIPLFRVGGIQIRLDFSWFIIFLLVMWSLSAGYFPRYYPDQGQGTYWLAGSIATLLFFASLLTHELAHAFMGKRFGMEIPAITLFVFGGMAHLAEEAKNPKTEFTIAVVGPLTSFVLAGVFWSLTLVLSASPPSLAAAIFRYLAYINLALGIFNLFPGYPLDGGRIFRAFWWWKSGSLTRATRLASDLGKGFALMLMILGALEIFSGVLIGGLWLVFIGMFLRGIAEGGYQQTVMQQSLQGVAVQDVMVNDVVTVPPELTLREVINDYFLRYGYRGFPVTREGNVVGMISLGNIKAIPDEERSQKTVQEVMIPMGDQIRITSEASVADALQKMLREDLGRLVVMQNGTMAGLVTHTGVLRFLEAKQVLVEEPRAPKQPG
ncbi:MAG: site-2 protease family protein [Candidatus Binatia bacterium]